MRIARTIAELHALLARLPKPALVPTMGSLHAGHLSLIAIAKARPQPVVASIFINRLQFAPAEDFDKYPRSLEQDCQRLADAGCDIVFAPAESEMYPQPQDYKVQPPAALADLLEGAFRPGFFTGVCTVVLKLFNFVQPSVAVFGKKDYQQLLIVRGMVRQLGLPIEVLGADIIREPSGLAMSSRNAYLTAEERREAPQLQTALQQVATSIGAGRGDFHELERQASGALTARGWRVDYLSIRRQDALGAPQRGAGLVVLAAAALGQTRLLDNVEVASP